MNLGNHQSTCGEQVFGIYRVHHFQIFLITFTSFTLSGWLHFAQLNVLASLVQYYHL